jgi:hypothetical protein
MSIPLGVWWWWWHSVFFHKLQKNWIKFSPLKHGNKFSEMVGCISHFRTIWCFFIDLSCSSYFPLSYYLSSLFYAYIGKKITFGDAVFFVGRQKAFTLEINESTWKLDFKNGKILLFVYLHVVYGKI